jgi:hypothetical protein
MLLARQGNCGADGIRHRVLRAEYVQTHEELVTFRYHIPVTSTRLTLSASPEWASMHTEPHPTGNIYAVNWSRHWPQPDKINYGCLCLLPRGGCRAIPLTVRWDVGGTARSGCGPPSTDAMLLSWPGLVDLGAGSVVCACAAGRRACVYPRARISETVTGSPAPRSANSSISPSIVHLTVESDHPWTSPSCWARTDAARSTGSLDSAAGCCHFGGGNRPALRR